MNYASPRRLAAHVTTVATQATDKAVSQKLMPVDSSDFAQAAQLCENVASRLRAGDALHLSVAKRCLATHIFSLDTDMLNNAIALGMSRMDHDYLEKPSR